MRVLSDDFIDFRHRNSSSINTVTARYTVDICQALSNYEQLQHVGSWPRVPALVQVSTHTSRIIGFRSPNLRQCTRFNVGLYAGKATVLSPHTILYRTLRILV